MIIGYLLAELADAVIDDDYQKQTEIATALLPYADRGEVTEEKKFIKQSISHTEDRMSKYNTLYRQYKEELNKNDKLTKENLMLTNQRKALSRELQKTEKYDKSIDAVFEAFSTNLVKSFKAKNIVNMNEDERNAMYYALEQYIGFADLLKLSLIDSIADDLL